MIRSAIPAALVVIGIVLGGFRAGQSPSDKNTIRGVVVLKPDTLSKSAYQPILDAVAIAYDLGDKRVIVSEPTRADGKFSLVVPESVQEFKLQVHQKQSRYWDYKPTDLILNNGHPHDLGQIVLNDKRELSENEVSTQVEAAALLQSIDDQSAAPLMDKVTQAYLREYVPPRVQSCPGGPVPTSIEVAYHSSPRQLTGSSDLPSSGEPSANRRAMMLLNAKIAAKFMQTLGAAERQYFSRTGGYGGFDNLRDSELAKESNYFPPGYCIELVTGALAGRDFIASKKTPLNYYLLFAAPTKWDVTGDLYLYSNPTGIVRYSRSKEKLKSLNEALPVPKDFPFGLAP